MAESAHERPGQILDQARADVESMRSEADEYAVETLAALEDELTRLLNQTRNGIAKMSAERERIMEPPELVREA